MDYFVHPSSFVDEGSKIGEGTKIWHFCHIMPEAVIGRSCVIGQNVMIGNKVILGDQVKVQNNVSLYEGVICEDDVFIGPSAVFTNVLNPRSAVERKTEFRTTFIRKGASIGANVTIVCGIEIGAYAFIGAGAVVTKAVPPYALVTGNPGRQQGWMSEYGQKLQFDASHRAFCKGSKQEYLLENDQVRRVK